jgi:hypothetical protein
MLQNNGHRRCDIAATALPAVEEYHCDYPLIPISFLCGSTGVIYLYQSRIRHGNGGALNPEGVFNGHGSQRITHIYGEGVPMNLNL